MDDKFKIIITDDNGIISMDVITGSEWLTVKETDLPKEHREGLSIFGLSKTIISFLKEQLKENGNSRNKSIESAKVR